MYITSLNNKFAEYIETKVTVIQAWYIRNSTSNKLKIKWHNYFPKSFISWRN